MENIAKLIKEKNLIKSGEVVGVALSGGQDSMALVHYLKNLALDLDFEIVAVHIDHCLRDESTSDAFFVMDWCKQNKIRAYKFKINVAKIAEEKNISIESAAREARYGVFKSLMEKGIIDKIAVAHHMEDQAETVLMHLLRGSGLSGARGMEIDNDGKIIRPMLETCKNEVKKYIAFNDIPYVQDETNFEDNYQRNFLRNKVMPLILQRWPNAVNALTNFSKTCAEDDDYICSQISTDCLILDGKTVKVPISFYAYGNSVASRLVFKALKLIGVEKDIERKHLDIIKNIALNGENGSRIKLPLDVNCYKEYDYITLTNVYIAPAVCKVPFKCGKFNFNGFGWLKISRSKTLNIPTPPNFMLDAKKLPKTAIWRYKKEDDVICKFGGGTKKLKTYFVEKKVPSRIRNLIPVLADGNEIYCVGGVGISNKVRIDEFTKAAYLIETDTKII